MGAQSSSYFSSNVLGGRLKLPCLSKEFCINDKTEYLIS